MAIAAPFPSMRSTRPMPTPSRRQPAIRLTRRGRAAVFIGSSLLLASGVIASGQLAGAGEEAPAGPATAVVVVQPGDSLWSIAKELAPKADPRETVMRLRELNGLGNAVVVPGQSIVVPQR